MRIDTRTDVPLLRPLSATERAQLTEQGCSGTLEQIRIAHNATPALRDIARTNFHGANWLLSPDLSVRDADIDGSVLCAATVSRSRVLRSLLGDHVVVESWSVVRDSVLAPFRRHTQGPSGAARADLFGVTVEQSQVSASVIWGGTDIGPFVAVRPGSIVGPFVHVGAGSEVKSSWLIGGSPVHRVEVPHRSYVGNCRVRAMRLAFPPGPIGAPVGDARKTERPWGGSAWIAAWEDALRAVRGGVWLDGLPIGIEDAMQPRTRVRFRIEEREVLVELESVNLGAVFTTSNFDPRAGGLKFPTEIGGGAKMGVLTWAQAPCVIGDGALVASGSRAFLNAVRTDSLAFGGAGEHAIKEEYFADGPVRLGDGLDASAQIALGYVAGIDAGIRVATQAASASRGIERMAWHAEADTLLASREESLKGLARFRMAITRSCEWWSRHGGSSGADRREDHRRALDRLEAGFPSPTIECGEAGEADLAEAVAFVAGAGRGAAFDAISHDDLAVAWAEVARATKVAHAIACHETPSIEPEREAQTAHPSPDSIGAPATAPRIFGTSGVRGRFGASSRAPLGDFVDSQLVTPELGYLLGRAFARLLARRGEPAIVTILHDVRSSSLPLAAAALEGLADEGVRVEWGGVATTPTATRLRDRAVVVVTASHNPSSENGFKFFARGRPIGVAFEDALQEIATEISRRPNLNRRDTSRPPSVQNVADTIRVATRDTLLRDVARLGLSGTLTGKLIVLDLAHGAAATFLGGPGLAPRLSPAIEAILATGAVVVGFAAEQDSERTNLAVGAAYPYEECRTAATAEVPSGYTIRPTDGEIAAFAAARAGYGSGEAGHSTKDGWRAVQSPVRTAPLRSVYFPPGYDVNEAGLTAHLTAFTGGARGLIGFDRDTTLRAAAERELAPLGAPLLAAAVDCDADRLLVTDAEIAGREPGFLDGDRLLATLALATPNVAEVVVTWESGIGAAALATNRGLPVVRTTVGDRAVGAALLRSGASQRIRPGMCAIGAEPSGHILIAEREPNRDAVPHIVDDPFAVILRLLAITTTNEQSLAACAQEAMGALDHDVVVRKPEAWGISLDDKRHLTLGSWRDDGIAEIGAYARAHVDFVARTFAALLVDLGITKKRPAIEIPATIASGERCVLGAIDDVLICLLASSEPYQGPEDIVVEVTQSGKTVFESVSRNSGTSAKSSCYWKANLGETGISVERLRAALERAATDRVAFTMKWLEQNRA